MDENLREEFAQLKKRVSDLENEKKTSNFLGMREYFKKAFQKTPIAIGISLTIAFSSLIVYGYNQALNVFTSGDTLSATAMNANFTILEDRIDLANQKILYFSSVNPCDSAGFVQYTFQGLASSAGSASPSTPTNVQSQFPIEIVLKSIKVTLTGTVSPTNNAVANLQIDGTTQPSHTFTLMTGSTVGTTFELLASDVIISVGQTFNIVYDCGSTGGGYYKISAALIYGSPY